MKKFSFSLQRLLDYKEQVLDIERAVLAEMNAVLRTLEAELEAFGRERAKRIAKLREKAAEGIPAIEMEAHKNFLTALDFAIKNKVRQIKLQSAAADKQQGKVLEVKAEISAMEKLRGRKLDEYNYKSQKADELFIEEFVSHIRCSGQ